MKFEVGVCLDCPFYENASDIDFDKPFWCAYPNQDQEDVPEFDSYLEMLCWANDGACPLLKEDVLIVRADKNFHGVK